LTRICGILAILWSSGYQTLIGKAESLAVACSVGDHTHPNQMMTRIIDKIAGQAAVIA
jgi:hypothetical protein